MSIRRAVSARCRGSSALLTKLRISQGTANSPTKAGIRFWNAIVTSTGDLY